MKQVICRAWNGNLNDYKEVLYKYNATYHTEGNISDIYAVIELESISELRELISLLDESIIIDEDNYDLIIYDAYIE